MSKSAIRILPVTLTDNANSTALTDLEAIYAIETTAFQIGRSAQDTALHQLMFGPPSVVSQNQRADELRMKLKSDSTFRIYKAVLVDEISSDYQKDEKIVGFAIWNFYNPKPRCIRQENNKRISPHRPRIFNDFFGALARKREAFMGNGRFAHLEFLAILPPYQRLGIGQDLLSVGLEEADRRGIPAWVESTTEAYGLYRSRGFSEVVEVTMDLRKYGADGI
ncbi:GNAT family N-acetyltransferase, partial [Aspergillus affinis]|uniref:GNAT family N-acetyltransferase n=1 Tax=Aspergillus affinis TaxID=1070780 RepID=UPI0022FF4421